MLQKAKRAARAAKRFILKVLLGLSCAVAVTAGLCALVLLYALENDELEDGSSGDS